jgi:glycolate oxidase iron-sulfur subunit
MKEYANLIGPECANVAGRTFDLSEFLLKHGLLDELAKAPGLGGVTVTYHDACHLSHGQKITSPPRELIQAIPNSNYVELPESMMCCGSAGVYNVLQPDMARRLLDRKVGHIQETHAEIVATGNPGCHAWIAQGCREQKSAQVMHTAELLEAAFVGLDGFA